MFPDGAAALCGEKNPRRIWQRWTLNALSWDDLVYQPCVDAWLNSAEPLPTTRAEHFHAPADDRQRQEALAE
jgi:hypothetical protein